MVERRRKKSGLEGRAPDLMRTLTKKDVLEVVYSVADKPYMQAYMSLLQLFRDKGVINQEPDLSYIASKAYDQLSFYGMFSILSRTRPTKGKEILDEFKRDRNGISTTYALMKRKGYAIFTENGDTIAMAPIELIRALRTRELRNLYVLEFIDPIGQKKTNIKIGRPRIE